MASEYALPATVQSAVREHVPAPTVLANYWVLTKPDVNLLIAITTAAGFRLALPEELSDLQWTRFVHTLAGTILVASGAASLNQWMERRFDARMRRTARRPVAAGRIEPTHALFFGTSLSLVGAVYLLAAAGTLPSLLATVTLLGYLLLYTPAKRLTPFCTLIGALPGAIPPLIGWAAARGRLEPGAWMLCSVVFLWQFPHFMAIAWMYRDDYDRAGYRVLPAGEARAPFVTTQTLVPLVALVLVSLLPSVANQASTVYGLGALLLGLGFSHCGARFALSRTGPAARRLLLASIVYLPFLFALLMLLRSGPRVME